jgi:hypothetical protein
MVWVKSDEYVVQPTVSGFPVRGLGFDPQLIGIGIAGERVSIQDRCVRRRVHHVPGRLINLVVLLLAGLAIAASCQRLVAGTGDGASAWSFAGG